MKDFLILVGKIALGVFIVGTLLIGAGTSSMKSTISSSNDHNVTNMANASSW